MSPDDIEQAFLAVHRVVDPLTRGDGEAAPVQAARVALQSLYLLRQAARDRTSTHRVRTRKPRQ